MPNSRPRLLTPHQVAGTKLPCTLIFDVDFNRRVRFYCCYYRRAAKVAKYIGARLLTAIRTYTLTQAFVFTLAIAVSR